MPEVAFVAHELERPEQGNAPALLEVYRRPEVLPAQPFKNPAPDCGIGSVHHISGHVQTRASLGSAVQMPVPVLLGHGEEIHPHPEILNGQSDVVFCPFGDLPRRATGHAEMLAIDQANQHLEAWRLEHATLYVTLEPCPMCAGALIMARVKAVVYGAADPKAGCAGSLMNLLEDNRFNHQPQLIKGILAEECGQQLTEFFRSLRRRNKARRQNKES